MLSTATPATSPAAQTALEVGTFTKRVGYTTYRVGVHFSEVSTETAEDKIVRLIRLEAHPGKAAGP